MKPSKPGLRVYYSTAADLAARCRKAAIEGRWATTMRFFAGPAVLIIDELGYLPMPTTDANALFQVISQRYLKSSIILTTNRGASAWGDIFGDTTPPSPPPCSTGSCTAAPSSTSPATATDSDPTKPATNNTQPLHSQPAPGWGISLIASGNLTDRRHTLRASTSAPADVTTQA